MEKEAGEEDTCMHNLCVVFVVCMSPGVSRQSPSISISSSHRDAATAHHRNDDKQLHAAYLTNGLMQREQGGQKEYKFMHACICSGTFAYD